VTRAAIAIVGRDREHPRRLRLVLVRSWTPKGGEIGFTALLDDVVTLCREQRVGQVYVDQYCSVPVREHLRRHGLSAREITMTGSSKPRVYSALKSKLYAGELELYRHQPLLNELGRIEAHYVFGAVSIRIPRLGSSHGDLAQAVSLAVSQKGEPRGPARVSVPRGRIGQLSSRRAAGVTNGRIPVGATNPPTLEQALAANGIGAHDGYSELAEYRRRAS
jgi:hypothetical protein